MQIEKVIYSVIMIDETYNSDSMVGIPSEMHLLPTAVCEDPEETMVAFLERIEATTSLDEPGQTPGCTSLKWPSSHQMDSIESQSSCTYIHQNTLVSHQKCVELESD